MHSAIVREPVNKVLQPVSVVHVKDLIFDFPEFCDIFLQLEYLSRRSLAQAAATQIPLDSVLLQAKENLRAV